MEFGDERLPPRFWAKIEQHPGGCWLWTAATSHDGYGQFKWNGSMKYAHKVAYEELTGPVPEGKELDHLCRVRACVRHTEPVTRSENQRRGDRATHARGAKHCRNGHLIAEAGVFVQRDGYRVCRECLRTGWKKKDQKKAQVEG